MTSKAKFAKITAGILVLVLASACSKVQFKDATSGVPGANSTSGGTDGSDATTGNNPSGGGDNADGVGNPPRNPGTDLGAPIGGLYKYTQTVDSAKNQVDFLLVIDDSTSMTIDQQKLAAKLSGFADRLSQLQVDWQMCVTVTRYQFLGSAKVPVSGYPINWSGNGGSMPYILKKGMSVSAMDTMVKATISKIAVDALDPYVASWSGDERGIYATYNSILGDSADPLRKSQNCYRAGSAISVILISDEDERSVGGNASRLKSAGWSTPEPISVVKAIEKEDKPEELLKLAKNVFGLNTRFTFNSIILKSNDSACEIEQDNQIYSLSDGKNYRSPSHAGTYYEEMSRLTNGGIASICEADYSRNLELFADVITNYKSEFTLKCAPVASTFKVQVVNASNNDITSTLSYVIKGATVVFNKDIVQGSKVNLEYYCQ